MSSYERLVPADPAMASRLEEGYEIVARQPARASAYANATHSY
jgi:hypothetical protein